MIERFMLPDRAGSLKSKIDFTCWWPLDSLQDFRKRVAPPGPIRKRCEQNVYMVRHYNCCVKFQTPQMIERDMAKRDVTRLSREHPAIFCSESNEVGPEVALKVWEISTVCSAARDHPFKLPRAQNEPWRFYQA